MPKRWKSPNSTLKRPKNDSWEPLHHGYPLGFIEIDTPSEMSHDEMVSDAYSLP